MSFYDIHRISYESLANQVKNSKPYRNSGNAYPLGYREYSARHFRALDDGSFSIWYMHRESSDAVIRGDEINAWYKDKKPLGVVRPDNSFEFTTENGMHQGENTLLSELLGVYIHQVKDKGGAVMTVTSGVSEYPIFTGLRFDIGTKKPLTQFTVVQPTLNRKRSNEHMKQYKEFLDVYPMFIKAMNDKAALEVIRDLYNQYNKFYGAEFNDKTLKEVVDKKHYVDAAFILYLLKAHWVRSNFHYHWREENGNTSEPRLSRDWQDSVQGMVSRHFRRTMLAETKEAFDWINLPMGKLPKTAWEHKIVSPTGEEFKQL
jgi:hypothetical protein